MKDVFILNVLYRGIARFKLDDGSTVLFWEDLWAPIILADAYPRLFFFASNTQLLVKDVMESTDLASILNLPLSQEACI